MNEPNFKEKPDSTGWWWCETEDSPVLVFKIPGGALKFITHGAAQALFLTQCKAAWWSGPITKPVTNFVL